MSQKRLNFLWSCFLLSGCGILWAGSLSDKIHLKRRSPVPEYNNAGPVGEVSSLNRRKDLGSDRRPAILNLNDELKALTELNANLLGDQGGLSARSLVQGDKHRSSSQEMFFNKFLVVDDQLLLFGENLKGVVTCKKGGGSLTVSEGREINTKKPTPDPNARSLQFEDEQLCKNALSVLKTDPTGQTRLIVVETMSEKVVRFDIR